MKKLGLAFIFCVVLLGSCQENRYLNGKRDQSIDVKFLRFDQDFNSLRNSDVFAEQTKILAAKYGEFFTIYNRGIVRLGDPQSSDYWLSTQRFLNDSIYSMIFDTVQYYFSDLNKEEKVLTEAFQNYKLVFPDKLIPQFYTHLSGFNEPIVVADSVLSVSLESYLGQDHVFYQKLGVYNYMLPKKNRENLVSDAMRGWLMSEFPYEDMQISLLDRMIEEGKLLFMLSVLMPDLPAFRLLGVTEEQYDWLSKNELNIWRFAVEQKHLFTTHQITIAKYMNDAPFFNFFGSGTSPLVGKYLGWRIVHSYMEKNKNTSIKELLLIKEGQEILESSGFKPKNAAF